MNYVTPLRYPGGKSKLADFMKVVFKLNDLVGGDYAELYAGGASLAFNLLFDGYAAHVHINDLSRSIYAFWQSAIYDTENFCRRIQDTPVTIDQWHQQKKLQENSSQYSTLDLGFSTFFLNRTNRSGIIKGGGVIGGNNQTGKWLLNARYNKSALIARIEKIAQYKDQISLYNRDALELLQELMPILSEKSLIYLDPPYYSKGRRLYENNYQHNDHVAVATAIKQLKRKWIVSYDNVPQICKLYNRYRKRSYGLGYTANDRYIGSEIMFFGKSLVLPSTRNPPKIKAVDYQLELNLR